MDIPLESGDTKRILALETERIGGTQRFPMSMLLQLASLFNVPPEMIFSEDGQISVLLGQDEQSILLSEVNWVNDIRLRDVLPDFMEDISLMHSPASRYLSINGAVGSGHIGSSGNNLYRIQAQATHHDGHFMFFSNPDDEDMKQASTHKCNFSVLKTPMKRLKTIHVFQEESGM